MEFHQCHVLAEQGTAAASTLTWVSCQIMVLDRRSYVELLVYALHSGCVRLLCLQLNCEAYGSLRVALQGKAYICKAYMHACKGPGAYWTSCTEEAL